MILVDTSVWIHYYRYKEGRPGDHLDILLSEERVVYNGIILGEILQGARSIREYTSIKNNFSVLPYIEFDYATWVKGGEIGYNLRRKGRTIPLADCLIAAQCLQAGYELFTTDKDFDEIAKDYSLTLVKI